MGERKNVYVMLVAKSEGSMCLYGNNIKTNLVEMVVGNVDRITFFQNTDQWSAFFNELMSLSVP
jgi:hypothetical protein